MRNYIKEIGSHGIIYAISNFLTKAIGLILIPVYAKHLSVSDYGILAIITPFIATVLVLFDFGLKSGYTRFYFDDPDPGYQRKLLGNTIFTGSMIGIVVFLFLLLFGRSFLERLFPGIPFVPFFRYALIIAFFSMYYEMLLNTYRTKRKSVLFGILSVLRFTLVLIVAIILIVHYQKGALGKVQSELYVSGLFFILCMILLLKEARFELDFSLIKNLLRYALPIVPHALSAIIVRIASQVILNRTDGLEAAGIYNMGFLIASIISLVALSVNQSWSPLFMKMAISDEKNTKKVFSQLSTYYILLLFALSFFFIVFSKDIVLLLANEKYTGSIAIVPVVIVSFMLNGIYYIFANSIMVNKSKVKLLPLLTISYAIINILANILLIGRYGMIGAAYAHLASTFYLVVMAFYFAQKSFKMDYEYKRILLLILTFGISFLAFRFLAEISISSLWVEISLKLLWTILPLVLLVIFRFFRKSELVNLLDVYRKTRKHYLGR